MLPWVAILTRMKVLVVDDHPLIREALRNVLTELDAKCELLESANSAGALGIAASHSPKSSGRGSTHRELSYPGG